MIEKYLKDKTYVIVTHRPKLKELCNKHYIFEEHIMKEVVNVQKNTTILCRYSSIFKFIYKFL